MPFAIVSYFNRGPHLPEERSNRAASGSEGTHRSRRSGSIFAAAAWEVAWSRALGNPGWGAR